MGRGNIAHRIPKVIAILGGMILPLSVEIVSPACADWRRVPTDKQQINMEVPGLSHVTPGYWKTVDEESTSNRGTAYHTKWRSRKYVGIHAYLLYSKRVKRFYYYTLRDPVQLQLGKDFGSFDGDVNTYDSKIGEFEYIHFSAPAGQAKIRQCVGFQRMLPGNQKIIYGHYCQSGNHGDYSVDEDMVGPLIDSIDLDYQANEGIMAGSKGIMAGSSGGFDGRWEGMMSCGSCANCLGPLEKHVNITIKNSKFDIKPLNSSYKGVGVVNDEGKINIESRKYFQFDGKYTRDSFVLQGVSGLRSCTITLSRVSSQ